MNPIAFDEPDLFKPNRWSDEKVLQNPFYYTPFSAGPKNCVG